MAFDAYIKIDGIDGESTDDKHKDWIELISFEHTCKQGVSGSKSSSGGGATGKIEFSTFKITKHIDKSTPIFYRYCAMQTNIPNIEMHVCRTAEGKEVYYKVVLKNSRIKSLNSMGAGPLDDDNWEGHSPLPYEVIEISYSDIQYDYKATDHETGAQGGVTSSGYNLVNNTAR